MKQILMLLILVVCACHVNAQDTTRPDEFPQKSTPSATDAIYSQEDGGDPVKILFSDARKYFSIQIVSNPQDPSASNNPENLRNKLVQVSSTNEIWFVDFNGVAVKLFDPDNSGSNPDTNYWQFSNGDFYQFSNGTFYEFSNN
jgi:hypothetical protein